jgi:hypothetical protein
MAAAAESCRARARECVGGVSWSALSSSSTCVLGCEEAVNSLSMYVLQYQYFVLLFRPKIGCTSLLPLPRNFKSKTATRRTETLNTFPGHTRW